MWPNNCRQPNKAGSVCSFGPETDAELIHSGLEASDLAETCVRLLAYLPLSVMPGVSVGGFST